MKLLHSITLLLVLCVPNSYARTYHYSEEYLAEKIKESEFVFVGRTIEVDTRYYIGETQTTKEKAEAIYWAPFKRAPKESGEDSSTPPDDDFHGSIYIWHEAEIAVDLILKGNLDTPKTIKIRWRELMGSLCPHPETQSLNKEPCFWFPNDKTNKTRGKYFPIPMEYEKLILTTIYELSQSQETSFTFESHPDQR